MFVLDTRENVPRKSASTKPYFLKCIDIFVCIYVDANDHAPQVTLLTMDLSRDFSMKENQPPTEHGPLVGYITASDDDSGSAGQVRCSSLEPQSFKLVPSGLKDFRIIATRVFDREATSRVSFAIQCEDSGILPTRIKHSTNK